MAERTCALIKPDAISYLRSGDIISLIELNGFKIIRMQKLSLTSQQAQAFYAVHKSKSFFDELVAFTISGPIIAMALEKDNAIQDWRTLMGATDPQKAAPGTIRKMFGTTIGTNAVHGSDSPETARHELKFFFPDLG
jgi:nucleoside-diphosphate kinase